MKRIPKQRISTIYPKTLNIKPEIVVEILKGHGQEVSLMEAEMILTFMFELTDMSINQVFEDRIILTD